MIVTNIIPVVFNLKYSLFFSYEGYAQGNDLTALIQLMTEYYIQNSINICKSYCRSKMLWKNITEKIKRIEYKYQ